MQYLSLLALVGSVTAAALPDGALEERATPCTFAGVATLAAAKAAFTQAQLVPDLIPQFYPDVAVQADWNGKQVQLGNTFNTIGRPPPPPHRPPKSTPSSFSPLTSLLLLLCQETLTTPSVSFTAEPGYDPLTTKYTYFLVDPDAPGPEAPILSNFLHTIVSDAQPRCITSQSRQTVAPYMPLTPLSVAPHRYTFLVYRQPDGYVPPPTLMALPGVRNNFDLNAYVAEAGLIGPVGGNFMREGLAQDVCLLTPGCTV